MLALGTLSTKSGVSAFAFVLFDELLTPFLVDLVNKVAEGTNFRVNKGFTEVEKVYKNKVSSEKEEKIFGYQFRTKEETTRDIIAPLIKAAA